MTANNRAVWEAASKMRPGSIVTVKYYSNRADRPLEMEGTPTNVKAREDWVSFDLVREDGQQIRVKKDGYLYSLGSHHPRNGRVIDVKVDNE